MLEAEWLTATDPTSLLALLPAPVSNRKCRLLACACVRQEWPVPTEFGCQLAVNAGEKMADGQLADAERHAAITTIEAGATEAANAWSYLVTAAGACLHPIGIDSADIALDSMDGYCMELFNRSDHIVRVALVRDIFGNPFRPVSVNPSWLSSTVVAIAAGVYQDRAFDRLPVLADALQDAGCDNEDVLNHCPPTG